MAFVNFQRYVCDVCGKSATQEGAVGWFNLARQEREPHCFMGYHAEACSLDCLSRAAVMPLNLFKRLMDETQKRANT